VSEYKRLNLRPFSTTSTTAPASRASLFAEELREIRERALQGGGKIRVQAQHKKGKLTARERIEVLLGMPFYRFICSLSPF
jgi:acetyl-CoA carboxylase carboxyltransferase component